MNKKLFFSLALGVFIYGCKNTASNEEIKQQDTVVTEEVLQAEVQEVILLDNGKKWVVVPEMMVFIKNIENAVDEFSKNENPSFKEYQNLSKGIAKNLEELTSNCTMTGQAHDELHKWLVPFLDLSAEFSKCANQQEAEKVYSKIKESFKEFVIYFE